MDGDDRYYIIWIGVAIGACVSGVVDGQELYNALAGHCRPVHHTAECTEVSYAPILVGAQSE